MKKIERIAPRATALLLLALTAGCSSSDPVDGDLLVDGGADADIDVEADLDLEQDAEVDQEVVIFHDPRAVVPTEEISAPRGLEVRRGIIHAHSVYSHDACDGEPFIGEVRNEACFEELRAALCDTRQDFVFLTDHDDNFADHEFPDVLLYSEGDELIERGGQPVANRLACGDGQEVIVSAGSESGTMPIGLERHVGDTVEARYTALNDVSEAGVRALQEAGALVFLHHTEEWPVETILALPIDGIEVYNLHWNSLENGGVVVNLLIELGEDPDRVPDVELGLVAFFLESEPDLHRWSVAAEARRTPAILASDVHRNAFNSPGPDGERLDSYRRMIHWFSNYVLVSAGVDLDDQRLKESIGRGRLYGAFDYLGYPEGFDFSARLDGVDYEMGDETPEGLDVELHLALPVVIDLPAEAPQPVRRAVILRAEEGGWVEVGASTEADLTVTVGPGVYRAEVRMIPNHLRPSLGRYAERYLTEHIWIYGNPIYVGLSR